MQQVLCKLSNEGSDVRCNICGQGFLVYRARVSRAEQDASRSLIQQQLRSHHLLAAAGSAENIHPRKDFNVPEWSGNPDYSAAALLSGVTAPAI